MSVKAVAEKKLPYELVARVAQLASVKKETVAAAASREERSEASAIVSTRADAPVASGGIGAIVAWAADKLLLAY